MSHTFSFTCKECTPNQKFTIEREASDIKDVGKVFCPGCGKQWGSGANIEWSDVAHFSTKNRSSNAVAKENTDMSRAAIEEASRDREYLDRTNPEVSPGIRKSQVDTINQRMGEALKNL